MKNIYELYGIRRKLSKKYASLVITPVVTVIFLCVMYSVSPVYICSSYLISSVFMYFTGVYISMDLHDRENDVFEEVLFLHAASDVKYYISREVLQIRISLLFSLVLSLYPVLISALRPGSFTRTVTPGDVICGGLIIVFCGICGTETGDLFHPRCIKNRTGVLLAVLISVLALSKYGLIQTSAVFNALHVLVPPIMDSFVLLGNSDRFDPKGILPIILHLFLFSSAVTLIKIILLKRFRFRM